MATSKKSAVKRLRERGCYEDEVVEAILDENYLCHVGFVFEDHVRVIPTCYGRDDRLIYLHGNLSNQMLKSLIDQVTFFSTNLHFEWIIGASGIGGDKCGWDCVCQISLPPFHQLQV